MSKVLKVVLVLLVTALAVGTAYSWLELAEARRVVRGLRQERRLSDQTIVRLEATVLAQALRAEQFKQNCGLSPTFSATFTPAKDR